MSKHNRTEMRTAAQAEEQSSNTKNSKAEVHACTAGRKDRPGTECEGHALRQKSQSPGSDRGWQLGAQNTKADQKLEADGCRRETVTCIHSLPLRLQAKHTDIHTEFYSKYPRNNCGTKTLTRLPSILNPKLSTPRLKPKFANSRPGSTCFHLNP